MSAAAPDLPELPPSPGQDVRPYVQRLQVHLPDLFLRMSYEDALMVRKIAEEVCHETPLPLEMTVELLGRGQTLLQKRTLFNQIPTSHCFNSSQPMSL